MPFGDHHKKQRPTRTSHCSDMNVNKIWENRMEMGLCMYQELKWKAPGVEVLGDIQCNAVVSVAELVIVSCFSGLGRALKSFGCHFFLSYFSLLSFFHVFEVGESAHRLCAPWNHELYMYKCFGSRIGPILHIKYYWHLRRCNFLVGNAWTSSSTVLDLAFCHRVSHRAYSSLVQLAVQEASRILLSLILRRT